jgi:hypothetical protein
MLWAKPPSYATLLAGATGFLLVAPAAALQVDWLQFFGSERHTGVNLQETIIHPGNVATLHVAYHVTLPAIVDGAPVALSGVTSVQGRVDLLFDVTGYFRWASP